VSLEELIIWVSFQNNLRFQIQLFHFCEQLENIVLALETMKKEMF